MKKVTSERTRLAIRILEHLSEFLALLVGFGILVAAAILIVSSYRDLAAFEINSAVQDGLFVLILLELFYVVRSFVKYGTVNIGLVVNVAIIALLKQLVFEIENISILTAIAFAITLISLGFVYYIETVTFFKKREIKRIEKELV